MATRNERLRAAAKSGAEVELSALLQDPGCDALVKGKAGMTALMCAAWNGHEGCIEILRPASDALAQDDRGLTALMWAALKGHEVCVDLLLPTGDALAQDDDGLTASGLARNSGRESLTRLIDAYALAHVERAAFEAQAGSGAPRGRSALRV